jgi:starch synthase
MQRILFAASEALPLVKTGGLADVASALPQALAEAGAEVRVLIPGYRSALQAAAGSEVRGRLNVRGRQFRILEYRGGGAPIWLADCPELYDRPGNPYHDAGFNSWPDNGLRFGSFCEVAARLALGEVRGWRADLVHANDWQTGLIPAWRAAAPARPRTVFTVHNLAYQGVFGRDQFDLLGLPAWQWSMAGVEFHGHLSFMKAGLRLADAITTVSPNYAREILTPGQGEGLDGLLRERQQVLSGILNGIDMQAWNPASDALIERRYGADAVDAGKAANKRVLQAELGLAQDADVPVVGMIGRLAYQKGSDLVIGALPRLLDLGVQFAVLGTGDPDQERAWRDWGQRAPGQVGVRIAYEERLAHLIEAGADMFLMPSRYEPCGLNQMYSQRYGTVPVVRRIGGLADTVVDASAENLQRGSATGIVFDHADSGGIVYGIQRALELYRQPVVWRGLRAAGMTRDFSWNAAARAYLDLYRRLSAGAAPAG